MLAFETLGSFARSLYYYDASIIGLSAELKPIYWIGYLRPVKIF